MTPKKPISAKSCIVMMIMIEAKADFDCCFLLRLLFKIVLLLKTRSCAIDCSSCGEKETVTMNCFHSFKLKWDQPHGAFIISAMCKSDEYIPQTWFL